MAEADHYSPILPTVKMLSLGCGRLPPPPKKIIKKKVLDHYLHHDLDMLPLLRCFLAHLLILQYPDHHQNLISSSLYYSGPFDKISSQSVHNVLSNFVHRQTNRQTDRQTDRTNQCYQKHNLLCQGGKKKRFWIITFTTIWVYYHYYGVFLLIYSSYNYNTQITTKI